MSFYADVLARNPRMGSPARVSDLTFLEPVTREAVRRILVDAGAMGVDLLAWETYRSRARQQVLYDRGASKLRSVGVHHYGLACDLVRAVGVDEVSWKGDWTFLGELARAHRLVWGGDWGAPGRRHGFVDAVHVQRCTVARQPSLFRGEWYPNDSYDPYQDGAR